MRPSVIATLCISIATIVCRGVLCKAASPDLPGYPADVAAMESPNPSGNEATAQQFVPEPPPQIQPAVVNKKGQSYRVMHWEFVDATTCKAFNLSGVTVLSRIDRFADVMFSMNDQATLAAVRRVKGIRWSEVAEYSVTPPPTIQPESAASRGPAEEIVQGGYSGLTGKGVIIAVLDTGIDFHHPDFISYDSAGQPTSRIRYFWDTQTDFAPGSKIGSAAPVSYPDGTSIGTVYSRDDLTADLRAATPQITGTDMNGHGTSCAGIAAGNGNAMKQEYTGVAPDADLVVVRIGDAKGEMTTEYLTGAIFDWLDKIAGQTPVVVSCSFGGFNCGHDGYKVFEREIDAHFPASRVGRAIVVAAGNNGGLRMHAALTFAGANSPGQLAWSAKHSTQLQIYVRANNPKDFQVTAGSGTKLTYPSASLNALTGQSVVFETIAAGKGSLSISSRSGRTCQADAYLIDTGAAFTGTGAIIERMVDTPGCSTNSITVGSYNWNNTFDLKGKTVSLRDSGPGHKSITIGELSAYSTPGFWRIGNAVKPELTAPGQWWTAPAPQNLPSLDSERDSTGRYRAFNGTSAATPYVAGIVALMLQKNPSLSFGQIRKSLLACLTTDEFTGKVPNIHWGYGKLDYDAVGRLLGGKYEVWVYKFVGNNWVKQDDRGLATDDAQQAKTYAAQVNGTAGWKATTNLPGQ